MVLVFSHRRCSSYCRLINWPISTVTLRFQIDNVHVNSSPNQYPDYVITLKAKNLNYLFTIVFDIEGDGYLFPGTTESA